MRLEIIILFTDFVDFSQKAKSKIKSLIKGSNYKHVYCQLIRTSEYVKNIHDTPKTIDYMDALSAGILRRVDRQPFYKKWLFKLEGNRLLKYEQSIFDFFENQEWGETKKPMFLVR